MKTYKIFSAKCAELAIKKGFEVLGTEMNRKFPQYLVYVFEDTAELQSFVSDYIKQVKQKQ